MKRLHPRLAHPGNRVVSRIGPKKAGGGVRTDTEDEDDPKAARARTLVTSNALTRCADVFVHDNAKHKYSDSHQLMAGDQRYLQL